MLKIRNRIPLSQLHAHPDNPRKQLTVDDLSESMKETGQLVPLLVRRIGYEKFQIISGHRRKAALVLNGEKHADCDVVEMTDEQAYKVLMVMNIQAQSLSEVEEAEGIKHMMNAYGWTQEKVSKELGKSKAWVSYRVSVLGSTEELKNKVHARELTLTHAREIAQLPKEVQPEVVQKVVEEKLSTRETAELVKQINHPKDEVSSTEVIVKGEDAIRAPVTILKGNNEPEIHASSGTECEIHDSSKTNHQNDERLTNHREIPSSPHYVEDKDAKRITAVHDFLLILKDFNVDMGPHLSIIDDLTVLGRGYEAIITIDKIVERLQYLKLHITNASSKQEGEKGELIEFRRKAE